MSGALPDALHKPTNYNAHEGILCKLVVCGHYVIAMSLTLLKETVSNSVPFSRAGNFWTLFIGEKMHVAFYSLIFLRLVMNIRSHFLQLCKAATVKNISLPSLQRHNVMLWVFSGSLYSFFGQGRVSLATILVFK